MESIDILITSASRPECMIEAMKSFRQYINYSGKFRWILHEDVVIKKESGKVLTWAKYSKQFDKIIKTEPAERLSNANLVLLKEARTKYVLKLEDDWIFIDDVDIDYMVDAMERNPEINQIYFNKSMNPCQVIYKNGIPLIKPVGKGPHEWSAAPGLWRLDWINPRWKYNTNAYKAIFEDPVCDYLYGKDLKKPNIHHIGKLSTSKVKVED